MVLVPQSASHDPLSVIHEARSGVRVLDGYTLESLADAIHLLAGTTRVPDLVRAGGCRVVDAPDLGADIPAALLPRARVILVRPTRNSAWTVLLILHELAHALLLGQLHTHPDVWALALALAFPRLYCRATPPVLLAEDDCRHVPEWAARLRQEQMLVGEDDTPKAASWIPLTS